MPANDGPMITTLHKRPYHSESRQKCRSYAEYLQRYRDKNVAPTLVTLSRQKCRSYEAFGQINVANTGWLCAGCAAGRLFRFVPVAACPAVAVLLSAGFPETAVVRWSSGSVL